MKKLLIKKIRGSIIKVNPYAIEFLAKIIADERVEGRHIMSLCPENKDIIDFFALFKEEFHFSLAERKRSRSKFWRT